MPQIISFMSVSPCSVYSCPIFFPTLIPTSPVSLCFLWALTWSQYKPSLLAFSTAAVTLACTTFLCPIAKSPGAPLQSSGMGRPPSSSSSSASSALRLLASKLLPLQLALELPLRAAFLGRLLGRCSSCRWPSPSFAAFSIALVTRVLSAVRSSPCLRASYTSSLRCAQNCPAVRMPAGLPVNPRLRNRV